MKKYYLGIMFQSVEGAKSYGTVSNFSKSANLVKFTEKRKSFNSVETATNFGNKIVNALKENGCIKIADETMGMTFTVTNDCDISIKVVSY